MFRKRVKFYAKVFSLRLLIKDYSFFLGFAFLVLLGGFTMPSMALYKLISRAIVSKILSLNEGYWLIVIVVVINLLLIKTSLNDKYALRNQAVLASILIFITFAFLSFLGFWLRVYLEYVTPTAEMMLGITDPTNSSLPPRYLPTAITVSITVSIFGVVFALASGSYSKVDYSPFKHWTGKVIETINKGGNIDIESLNQDMNDAIETLLGTLPYERYHYSQFVQDSLLKSLRILSKFLSTHASNKPELINELPRETTHIAKLSEFNQAYKDLQMLFKLG